jgi:transcriptional regulator with XRE-family HTH domain
MEKTKLIQMRKFKGFSQQQIADQLCMGTTTYHRRENRLIEINIEEKEKKKKILNVPLKEIFESDEKQLFMFRDNAIGNYNGTNHISIMSESLIETQQELIIKLEEENKELKRQLEKK